MIRLGIEGSRLNDLVHYLSILGSDEGACKASVVREMDNKKMDSLFMRRSISESCDQFPVQSFSFKQI